ncbi:MULTISPECIES: AMP-binding protein [unclassified Streptomyces]|uniref:AMP-binding protein n=1 Tax=unclassified Streptomyces TaxID=2593676 RepID=UPI0016601DBA|nr:MULTISPECIES: AMP-binding protein [unclassified Streptomyces]MBD0709614.1 2-aminobenzoate-CoA ligase [Streptomyces sp. CBMA291]MBD0714360.1 2-aminobenzoate-CoA ligase [Streptomyces sp. CBMA370]
MELTPSAHLDTFARDRLPPPAQWPRLLFDLPELAYPDRLNCGEELLDRTVERFGADRPAFLDGEGGVWSYGLLRERVDRIAHVLTSDLRVLPGNRVLLRGPTTPWLAACWLAVMKAGAIAVTVLAQQRAPELAVMAEAARCTHALCAAATLDELLEARVPGLRVTPFGGEGPDDLLALAARHPGRYTAVPTAADDVALIAFTSGTTGRPKGCVHFHRDVLAVADTFSAHVLRPLPDDVFAGSPPLAFTFGLGGLVVFPLRAGASTVLLEQAGPKQLLAAVERHRISVLFTAPTAYRVMLDELAQGTAPELGSLRRCVSAGENLPEATWQAWYARTGLRLINGIGATELLHIFLSAADGDIRPGTTGRPVPGWRARIVDRAGREVPDGEEGLLAVRGPVGCRYLADPRQTEYVRDGWNVTGDTCVREPDGYFRYVSRADDMIISAGFNIAGPQVEEVLLTHPDVVETAVVGRPDALRGQIVVAYTVVREGVARDAGTAAALRAFVRARLAPYKSPREIVFLDALPRTATGKIQRFRLRGAT